MGLPAGTRLGPYLESEEGAGLSGRDFIEEGPAPTEIHTILNWQQ